MHITITVGVREEKGGTEKYGMDIDYSLPQKDVSTLCDAGHAAYMK